MKPSRIQFGSTPDLPDSVSQTANVETVSEPSWGKVPFGFVDLVNAEQQIEQLKVVTRYRLQVVADGQVRVPETKFDRPETAARYFWLELGDCPQETMVAAFVDMRNVVIGWQEAFRGTLTRCTADPRAILQAALLVNAAGIVLCHNHPTGDPDPSQEDVDFTTRMKAASELLGIRLMDHLILGEGGRWVSLKSRGGC